MKPRRVFLIVALLLLGALIACGPVGAPTPMPFGPANIQGNNQAKIANSANLPPPPSLAVCPPDGAMTNVNSFCANVGAQLGGVSYSWEPGPAAPSGQVIHFYEFFPGTPSNVDCTGVNDVCTGPVGAVVTVEDCSICATSPTWQTDLKSDPSVCANGYQMQSGICNPVTGALPHGSPTMPCAQGTHYDTGKQNCVNDVTGQVQSPCPAGYPYLYSPGNETAQCYKNPQQISYNCQSYQVPLGLCPGPQHKPGAPAKCVGTVDKPCP